MCRLNAVENANAFSYPTAAAIVPTFWCVDSSNTAARPSITLLWPSAPGAGYALIVDGTGRAVDRDGEASLAIAPTRAVLHRTPEGDPASPSCVTLL